MLPRARRPAAGQDLLPARRCATTPGNWATTAWLFRKGSGAEEKLDTQIKKPARIIVEQVGDIYDPETAEFLLNKGLSFRAMHSHGRALNALLPHAVDDVEDYDVREGELISNVVNGWNFGDGHFHGRQLLEAIQERCGFEPGDVRVIALESEPTGSGRASATRSGTRWTGCSRRAPSRRARHDRRASPGSMSATTSRSRSTGARSATKSPLPVA